MIQNLLLYLIVCVIWSTTWLVIHLQVGEVPVIWSLIYRFVISAVLLLIICLLSKKSLKLTFKQHLMCVGLGLLIFSVSYLLNYLSLALLISGLVAVLNAAMIFFNVINARIFFKTPITWPVVVGAIIGAIGLATIFYPQILQNHGDLSFARTVQGIILALGGTLLASFGAMLSMKVHKKDLPIMQSNAYGMLYGALITMLIAFISGVKPVFDFTPYYLFTLGYLSILGSIITFGCYFLLLQRIDPAKVAYIYVITPVVSMMLSTYAENLSWLPSTFYGVLLVVLGSVLVLKYRQTTKNLS